ncbi:helix-turn-helix transcriptional regulator [Pseudarthrobacter equi]|uniref:helix-turn-helix domain-containing protein n=1 Tax=Pseudarthrobacter equi TaxID=728066 RepID=UPI0021C22417|nr:helix-turn-helix transcriptional regulator [Pseudarthrobacter equi]MCT9624949.1 helix-turn-helix transcriptional regulator [Pseudarthrobacter equi]
MSLRTWPQITGRATADDLIRVLSESHAGVLLTGAPGSGKSYLTGLVVKEMRNDAYVVVLRASTGLAGVPYGSLNVLLRDLDAEFLSHPALVLSALTGLLTERAQGRQVYLVMENAADVDEFAGVVISQLARNGTARLILTCTDPQRLCSEISRLCADGHLERIELDPLPLPDAIAWLEASLGGRISASAAHEFWTASGGNPHYLKMLAGELVESGSLSARNGVWVLTQTGLPHGPAITDLITTRLGKLSAGERTALEIVSLARAVPLEALLAIALPDDVDSLEKRGILVVDDSLPRIIGMQNQLLCDVIRANIPTGRSTDLWRQFRGAVDPGSVHPALTVALAAWALECGAPLGREEALRAAMIANIRMDYPLALRLVRSIPGYRGSAAAVAEESSALIGLGAVSEARTTLRRFRQGNGEEATPDSIGANPSVEMLRFELAEAAVHLGEPDSAEQTAERLLHVRNSLGRYLNGPSATSSAADVARLREQLVLAEAQAAGNAGRYTEVATLLEDALQDFEVLGPEFRFLAGSRLCEAWAMTGRQTSAADLVGQLLADNPIPTISAVAAWSAAGRLRLALLIAGSWDTFNSIVAPHWDSRFPAGQPFPASFDLSLALLRCLQGRGHEGLESLIPLIGQLRVRDDEGLLGVACAAAAYASMLKGEQQQARHFLAGVEPHTKGGRRTVDWMARYFAILAGATGQGVEAVTDGLRLLADEDHEAGNYGLELFTLSSAVRLGETAASSRLLEAALKCQGDYAGLCACYANALLAGDAAQQVAAAQLAQNLHHDRLAFDAAESVIHGDQAHQDRRLLMQARRVAETCRHRMRSPQGSATQEDRLTARELEIASLAANGQTNKGIAAQLHISVRTVEGHLYQIYGKLQIEERSELSFALGLLEGSR